MNRRKACLLLVSSMATAAMSPARVAAAADASATSAAANAGPVRVFALLRRRADLDFAAFSQHWRTRHAEASMKLTDYFERYVQNHLAPEPYPGFVRAFDGGAELWYPSLQRSIDLGNSEAYRSDAAQDNHRFQDVDAMRLLVTDVFQTSPGFERPVPRGWVKSIVFWKRDSGLSAAMFRERFLATTTPVLLPAGHYAGFERGIAVSADGSAPAYDAFEQFWWASASDYAQDVGRLAADRFEDSDLVDAGSSMALKVDEITFYWPPHVTGAASARPGPLP